MLFKMLCCMRRGDAESKNRSSSSAKQQREEGHDQDDWQASATWFQPNWQAYLSSPVTYISIGRRRCLYPNRTPSTSSFTTRKQTKESAPWPSAWPAYTPTGSAIRWKNWIVRQIRKCNYTTLSWIPRKENGTRPADAWSPPGKRRRMLAGVFNLVHVHPLPESAGKGHPVMIGFLCISFLSCFSYSHQSHYPCQAMRRMRRKQENAIRLCVGRTWYKYWKPL